MRLSDHPSSATALKYLYMSLASLLYCAQGLAQTEPTDDALRNIESVLATSMVLTDTEAVTFGVLEFDPNSIVPLLDGEYASENSIERRRSVTTYTLPTRWQLSPDNARLRWHVAAHASYLRFEQDMVIGEVENPTTERAKSRVYDAYIANGWSYQVNERWRVSADAGLHLLRYSGGYQTSNSDAPTDVTALIKSDATALIGEAQGRLLYKNADASLPWEIQSTYSYYYGRTVSAESNLDGVRPETWSWSNSVIVRWHLSPIQDIPNQLRFLTRRIDLGGDVTHTFDTHHYYEFGVGWLFDTHEKVSWMGNIGLSVSVNIGSALSGGSIVLLYNEE